MQAFVYRMCSEAVQYHVKVTIRGSMYTIEDNKKILISSFYKSDNIYLSMGVSQLYVESSRLQNAIMNVYGDIIFCLNS